MAGRNVANHILQNLPREENEPLCTHLEPICLRQGDVLSDVVAPITYGYFPQCGLVTTLVVMREGDSVEAGLLGSEGFAGLPILLNIAHSSSRFVVQIAGEAMRIKAEVLHELLPKLPMLERLLSRFGYLQALQMEQLSACNALHEVEERLALWLVMVKDRVPIESLTLTHDQLGRMLGTRRASVSVAASVLQRLGIIDYSRGSVRILRHDKLEEVACECYDIVHTQLEAYLNTGLAARPYV